MKCSHFRWAALHGGEGVEPQAGVHTGQQEEVRGGDEGQAGQAEGGVECAPCVVTLRPETIRGQNHWVRRSDMEYVAVRLANKEVWVVRLQDIFL